MTATGSTPTEQADPEAPSSPQNDCGYLEQLSDFIDGELAPELCAELEQHMAECTNCRIVVDTLRKTISLYHTLGASQTELPADVEERLWRRFELSDLLQRVKQQGGDVPETPSTPPGAESPAGEK